MKTFGYQRILNATHENFTTDFGIRLRRAVSPVTRWIMHLGCSPKIICEQYPNLEKNTPYIFCPTHLFTEDIISSMAVLDRAAYILMGCTDQIIHNPLMSIAWATGLIYVNRLDPESRADAVRKMERILNAGTSVLLFPEGGWNNTENLLVQPLFSGPYQLAVQTGCQVVPLSAFKTDDGSRIYIRAANPIDLSHLEKDAALDTLRDAMASLMYENILHHGETVSRDTLRAQPDSRLEHMRRRRAEYLETPWTADVWEEELAFYKSRKIAYPSDVWACMDSVTVTAQNAQILAPILLQRESDQKYDFKNFMHRTWNAELPG